MNIILGHKVQAVAVVSRRAIVRLVCRPLSILAICDTLIVVFIVSVSHALFLFCFLLVLVCFVGRPPVLGPLLGRLDEVEHEHGRQATCGDAGGGGNDGHPLNDVCGGVPLTEVHAKRAGNRCVVVVGL